MRRGRAAGRAALVVCAAAAPLGAAAAQSFPAQPSAYLLGTTAGDARAVWVNPAGLARSGEASIGADVTASFGGGRADVTQFGATLASRGVAFGWSRTEPRPGTAQAAAAPAITTLVLGLGLGDEAFSAGGVRRWYRSRDRKDAAWEIGARVRPRPSVELSLVWRDIGSPAVSPYRRLLAGDSVLPSRLIPGAGLVLLDGRFRLGAEWESAGDYVASVTRVGWTFALSRDVIVMARGDLSSRPEERRVAIAAQWSQRGVRGLMVAARPDAFDRQDLGAALHLYAPPPMARRPRR